MATAMATTRVRPPGGGGLVLPRQPATAAGGGRALARRCPAPAAGEVKAVIAPHAGYVYSGEIAAIAFVALGKRAKGIERVVVIESAHYVALRGIAIPGSDVFETPLGGVPVDREKLAAIAELPWIATHDAAHAPEHALEVELPFLQSTVGDFKLVPLVVGDAAANEVAQPLARLWGGEEKLIVISSDLSHYHDYDTAKRLDGATAGLIERGEWGGLHSGNACGYCPLPAF